MSDKKKVHYQGDIDRCGVTRKIRFKSYGQAKWRAKEILSSEHDSRSIVNATDFFRIYGPCNFCGGYHLTSQAKKRKDALWQDKDLHHKT